MPHDAMSDEHTVMDDEPLVEPVLRVRTEPLILACITLELESFCTWYMPFPPLSVIGKFCPLTTIAFVWLKFN